MTGPAFLRGDRISLRTREAEDIEFVRDTVNDPQVWRSLGGQTTPTNLEVERRFFEEANRSDDTVQFVITTTGEAGSERLGLIELEPIEWERARASVSFAIAPAFQGEGYAREALEVLAEYAFDQLGLHKLTAEAFATNEASRNLLESVGFVEEGRLRAEEWIDGGWVDVIRYGLLVDDRVRDDG